MSVENAWRVVDRALRDGEFAERLTHAPEESLESLRREFPGLSGEEAQATLQEAITALGVHYKLRTAAREEEHRQIREMSNGFRQGLLEVIRQVEAGYSRVMLMYTIAFYLGIALIVVSAVASLVMKEHVAALVLGGLGMADVVTAFIFRPAQELQNSRGNLTQLQAAFFNWANDVRNWSAYLERLDNSVRPREKPPYEEFEKVSLRVQANTAEMMRLVDLYCEMHPQRKTEKGGGKSGGTEKQGQTAPPHAAALSPSGDGQPFR
ncbi:MAG: hypothetical protein FJ312_02000 [SAR202 cluster bacterium]|nr:hypothetical protein [SAR202 cluster bacterium]